MGVMKIDLCRRASFRLARMAVASLLTLGAATSMTALPIEAQASTAAALGLDQLTILADRVIVGEVLSVESRWDAEHKRIFTNIQVQVAEAWKGGTAPGGKVLVQQPGGRVGDIESRVHGLAEFRAGDRAVLFLKGAESASAVLGLGQGVRPLRFDAAAKTWMVMGGDRSAAVKAGPNGHFVPADADPILTLETLRAQIMALVRR